MPDGYQIWKQAGEYANTIRQQQQLIDSASAPDTGAWIDGSELNSYSLDVTGNGTGFSIQLMGSNAALMPANSASGNSIGAAITTNSIVPVTTKARWIKAAVTAITGGAVSVILYGTN